MLTKSRTAAAAILVAIGTVLLVQTPLRLKCLGGLALTGLACAGLWLVCVCGYDPLADFHTAFFLGRVEESETLSGRAFIWPEVMYYVSRRPWLGYGYESFWTPGRIDAISDDLGWGLREAHNAYLEILLSLGLVGLTLTLVVAGSGLAAAVRGHRDQRDMTYSLPLGILVFGLISAGLESGMVLIELVTFMLGCCLLRMALFKEMTTPPTTAHCPLATAQ
jgi:exopolysaccharide production protein ExoQ